MLNLPPVSELLGPVAVDTETSGLYVDDGDRVCAVSLAWYLKGEDPYVDPPHTAAFPFDQGRHESKGFAIARYKDGRIKGGLTPEQLEEWTVDLNLPTIAWYELMTWLEDSGRAVGHVYQNAPFDLLMIDAGLRDGTRGCWLEQFVLWDTMLASKCLWPTESTSLKPTSARLWGEAEVEEAAALKEALLTCKKLFGLRAEHGPRYDLVPWSINGPYAAKDTELTLRLFYVQRAMLEDGYGNGWSEFQRSLNLARVCTRMMRRGFGPYRWDDSNAWANLIAERIMELEARLPFTPASSVRATEFYYEELGLTPWRVSETRRGFEVKATASSPPKFVPGRKADRADVERRFPGETVVFKQGELTADIAQRMADEDAAPGAADYAEYLRLKIANQMFYRNYCDLTSPDGKLRTTFRVAHVKSGRLSVERFQAQALPKKLALACNGRPVPEPRAFFAVPEGRVRWNLDLSQAELRIAANLAGCTDLIRALAEGADVHGQTCERTFGITAEHPDWKGKRDVAKRLNFGGIFMIGPKTFRANLWEQAGVDWPLADCKVAVDGFRAAYPEIPLTYEHWLAYARDKGCVVLYNGERSWMGPRDYPNTAWNRVVQGSLAAWASEWLTLVEQLTSADDALVLSVHDSAVLDLPVDTAEETVKRVVELSEELWFDRFGFVGRVDSEPWTYHLTETECA